MAQNLSIRASGTAGAVSRLYILLSSPADGPGLGDSGSDNRVFRFESKKLSKRKLKGLPWRPLRFSWRIVGAMA
jgi:hypothetical protein